MAHPDLSDRHGLISDLFTWPQDAEAWEQYRLSSEQVAFYHEHGYVANVPLLTDAQCDVLCEELSQIAEVKHPGHDLFYEFHSNESSDPGTVLFHSLGAWRITLTLPAINRARQVTFLVAGPSKAEPLARIRAGEDLPAGLVQPVEGTLTWLVDREAARSNHLEAQGTSDGLL